MKNEPVARVMTEKPEAVRPSDSLAAAERIMREQSCHHVPVVDDIGRVVGIVSAHDLMKAAMLDEADEAVLNQSALQGRRISEIMHRTVVAVPHTATLLDAAKVLARRDVHAVPVVAPGGVLSGIITSNDLIEVLVDALIHPVAETGSAGSGTEARSEEQRRALEQVYKATVHYLESGSGDLEHTRLLKAVATARERLGREALPI